MLSLPVLLAFLLFEIMDPLFRFPGVCNIFPWFC